MLTHPCMPAHDIPAIRGALQHIIQGSNEAVQFRHAGGDALLRCKSAKEISHNALCHVLDKSALVSVSDSDSRLVKSTMDVIC